MDFSPLISNEEFLGEHMSEKLHFVILYVLGFLCLERSKLLHMTGNAIKGTYTAPQFHIGELELI